MTRAVIIVAAGSGSRLGGNIPKQHQVIGDKTVLQRSVAAFRDFDQIVVVHRKGDSHIGTLTGVTRVEGGETRTASVRAGLSAIEIADHVYIHDAARPFVGTEMITQLGKALETHQSAVPVLPIVDAVKAFDGRIGPDVDRARLRRVQTPQAFRRADIETAYANHSGDYPDDIAVAQAAGLSVATIEGDPANYKITHPADLDRARRDVEGKGMIRIGQGYDVHQICEGDHVWIGGVKIDCGFGLLGHSDADVGLHAITDALLGACAKGDIGDHFPPSDPQWKGAASDQFLAHAVSLCDGVINNIDLTVVCERPKIKPHRDAMRARIAKICGLDVHRVSVKATTTETLGFEGRGEGISAQAIVAVTL